MSAREIDALAKMVGKRFVPNTCQFQCKSLDECKRRPECEPDERRALRSLSPTEGE